MAPSKSLPPAKLSLVLNYFRTTSVAYTLKDLEKSLPSVAGISSMTVKDYLTALVAENLLCVEKIGSGNWYWSFPADAKRQKEAVLVEVNKEREKIKAMVDTAEKAVAEERERLRYVGGEDRVELGQRLGVMEGQREELQRQVDAFSETKGAEVVMGEAEKLRLKHNELVDNLFTLEKHFRELVNGDAEKMAGMREYIGIEEDMDTMEK